jgi:Mg/Co/Ni transporter MgtE
MPTVGSVGDRRRIGHFVEPASTVAFVGTITDLPADADDVVVVVSPAGVVAGALDARTASSLPPTTPVVDSMDPAPGTIRPEKTIDEVAEQLRSDGLDHVVVTTISGVLLGIVHTERLHV